MVFGWREACHLVHESLKLQNRLAMVVNWYPDERHTGRYDVYIVPVTNDGFDSPQSIKRINIGREDLHQVPMFGNLVYQPVMGGLAIPTEKEIIEEKLNVDALQEKFKAWAAENYDEIDDIVHGSYCNYF